LCDDPEAKGSVHAPVALGPLALLLAPELQIKALYDYQCRLT